MVVLPNEAELLEKRLMELCAQLDNVDIAQSASPILERSQLRLRLCQEYIELSNRLRDLKAAMPEIPPEPEKVRRESRGDVMIWGRTRLKLEEAIERALEQSDWPLRADEIAQIVSYNGWIREPSRNNYVEAVRGALQRHREKLGIVCVGDDRRNRKYWLSRRGAPPEHH
jgi:hypothetical protein